MAEPTLLERWTLAADAAIESFRDSKKPSNEVQVVESGDGKKTTTKRVQSAGPGDAKFLAMHLECLREIERLKQPRGEGQVDRDARINDIAQRLQRLGIAVPAGSAGQSGASDAGEAQGG